MTENCCRLLSIGQSIAHICIFADPTKLYSTTRENLSLKTCAFILERKHFPPSTEGGSKPTIYSPFKNENPLGFPSNINIVLRGHHISTLVLLVKKTWASMAFSRPHPLRWRKSLIPLTNIFNRFTVIGTAVNPIVTAIQLFGGVLHTQERGKTADCFPERQARFYYHDKNHIRKVIFTTSIGHSYSQLLVKN